MNFSEDTSLTIRSKIRQCVRAVDPDAEVILFGSRARGDARVDSDWDILILSPQKINLKIEQIFRHKLFEVELEYGQPISTFVCSTADWHGKHRITPLYNNIKKEGVPL